MDTNYLIVFDENGHRLTSYVLGIHGESMEELVALATKEHEGATLYEGTAEEQSLAVHGGRFIDGKIRGEGDAWSA